MRRKKKKLRMKKDAVAPPAPEVKNEHHIHVNVMPSSNTHVEVPEHGGGTVVTENSADRSLKDLRSIGRRGY